MGYYTWDLEAQRGEAKRGRPKQSYLSTLIRDVGTKIKEELGTLMWDRDLWRRISAIGWTYFRLSSSSSIDMTLTKVVESLTRS